MNCLFLGYNSKQTKIISFLKSKGIKVKNIQKKINFEDVKNFDFIISFGYRKIIKNNIIKRLKKPIINLHMSYLPYNKGAHPNYWSFVKDTKKGVSIHEIDKGIDTGNIIVQKELKFNLKKSPNLTFKSSYSMLFKELENLFIKNYKKIIYRGYRIKKNRKIGNSLHNIEDLPLEFNNWNVKIYSYLKKKNDKKK